MVEMEGERKERGREKRKGIQTEMRKGRGEGRETEDLARDQGGICIYPENDHQLVWLKLRVWRAK